MNIPNTCNDCLVKDGCIFRMGSPQCAKRFEAYDERKETEETKTVRRIPEEACI